MCARWLLLRQPMLTRCSRSSSSSAHADGSDLYFESATAIGRRDRARTADLAHERGSPSAALGDTELRDRCGVQDESRSQRYGFRRG